jgi:hypothetical protein
MLMTSIAFRKLTMTALLLGGMALLPSLVHAQEATGEASPPTDVGASEGTGGDGAADGGTVVDDTPADGGVVDGGAVDGGDGEVTANGIETDYDPVIAQSGVPQAQGTPESQRSDGIGLSGEHGSGNPLRLPRHGARRSLFGSNSPLHEWLDN